MSLPYEYTKDVALERVAAMHALLLRGMTLTEVGEVYSMSRQRVTQLVAKHFPDYRAPRGRRPKKVDGIDNV